MALALADELQRSSLQVVLTPAERAVNPGASVRTVVSENPEWYQKLCAAHVSDRKRGFRSNRTRVRRKETLMALHAIADGRPQRAWGYAPTYHEWLMPIIESELAKERAERRAVLADVRASVPF